MKKKLVSMGLVSVAVILMTGCYSTNRAIKDVTYIPARTVFERLKAIGKDEEILSMLTKSQLFNVSTLEEGIAVNDSEVIALLTAIGVDPGTILY